MRKNIRTLVSETKYAKKSCPICNGTGYWRGGVDWDYFECDHIKRVYKDSLVKRVILHKRGCDILECELTKSQKRALSQFLSDNDIDYEFI